jgi:hypothetical protein
VPTVTGYKPAAGKTVDEYRNLDAKDESLARWKASLGLDAAASGDTSGPKVIMKSSRSHFFLSIFHLAYHFVLGTYLPHTSGRKDDQD